MIDKLLFILPIVGLYSGSQLSEVQEPHPQPPPRKRGGDYDVPHVISKRYKSKKFSGDRCLKYSSNQPLISSFF
ncbi:MAG: hypothetical protein V7L09_05205 [Nostoc sp.]|uniref:hypothetical protein n=1 Tax=Nostoc sp. TaxID=1180 RepID=UPI002FF1B7DF